MASSRSDEHQALLTLSPKASLAPHQSALNGIRRDAIPFAIAEPVEQPQLVRTRGAAAARNSNNTPSSPNLDLRNAEQPQGEGRSGRLVPSTRRGQCACRVGMFITSLLAVCIVIVAPSILIGGRRSQQSSTVKSGIKAAATPTEAPLTTSSIPTKEKATDDSSFKIFNSTQELYDAVDAYLLDSSSQAVVALTYGWPMNQWDVSRITNFSRLFDGSGLTIRNPLAKYNFNDDLSDWDVSSATDMSFMFQGARSMNGDFSRWDTHNLEDARYMFESCILFEGRGLSSWNVSKLSNANQMFEGAHSFRHNLCPWGPQLVQAAGGHPITYNRLFANTDCPEKKKTNFIAASISPLCFKCRN